MIGFIFSNESERELAVDLHINGRQSGRVTDDDDKMRETWAGRDKDRCGGEGGYVGPVGFHMATEDPPPFGDTQSHGTRRAWVPIKQTAPGLLSSIERVLASTTTLKGSSDEISSAGSERKLLRSSDHRIALLTMQPIYAIALLAAILLIDKCYSHPTIRQRQELRPRCVGCGDDCNKCKYGVAISTICGIEECRRGPGEICGGPSQKLGVCGDGLICSCNRCSGCSLDSLTCYTSFCPPHQILEQRGHLDIIDRFPLAK